MPVLGFTLHFHSRSMTVPEWHAWSTIVVSIALHSHSKSMIVPEWHATTKMGSYISSARSHKKELPSSEP